MSGLPGENTITCWSGCMTTAGDWASALRSVKRTPASVERTMVRPFEPPCQASSYWNIPPSHTVFGSPGGLATTFVYSHCSWQ